MNLLAVAQFGSLVGGANKSFLDVLIRLKRDYNYNIYVIAPSEGELSKALKEKGIEVFVFSYTPNAFQIRSDIFDGWRMLNALKRDIACKAAAKSAAKELRTKNIKYDKIYINDSNNTFGYYLAMELGIRYVWHLRNYQADIKKYVFNERKIRQADFGKYIAISYAMKKHMVNCRGIREDAVTVIHNGVENHNIIIKQPWHSNIDKEIHIVHCGMLMEIKGQKDSIKAVYELRKEGYNVFLHLAGPSQIVHGKSYQDILQKLVNSLELNNYVLFEGRVQDMPSFRKKMHFELMCSKAEPFGRVTVEGMQAGLVVIGSDTGATPEIITDGVNGLLYKHGDYLDLANKIKKVCDNYSLGDRLSQGALKTTENNFTMEKNVKEIQDILSR